MKFLAWVIFVDQISKQSQELLKSFVFVQAPTDDPLTGEGDATDDLVMMSDKGWPDFQQLKGQQYREVTEQLLQCAAVLQATVTMGNGVFWKYISRPCETKFNNLLPLNNFYFIDYVCTTFV